MTQVAQATQDTDAIRNHMVRAVNSTSAIHMFDFTIPKVQQTKEINTEDLLKFLRLIAKKWCVQLERGDVNGYIHYQGRLSLKVRSRKLQIAKQFLDGVGFAHLSETSGENYSNMFYVQKEETRIDGPWSDQDINIPSHLRATPNWFPWQAKINIMMLELWARQIGVIVDPIGGQGKSTLFNWHAVRGHARKIPLQNDARDISRMVLDMPKVKCYFIDLPRAGNIERKMPQMYSAIEEIKNGYAYDDRHQFREEYFEIPQIFVITNSYPDLAWLTNNRWSIFTIVNQDLVPVKSPDHLVRLHTANQGLHLNIVPSVEVPEDLSIIPTMTSVLAAGTQNTITPSQRG